MYARGIFPVRFSDSRAIRAAALAYAALGAVAASPAPTTSPTAGAAKGGPNKLLGRWNCEAYAPQPGGMQQYRRNSDGSVSLESQSAAGATPPASPAPAQETFRFDSGRGSWTATRSDGDEALAGGDWSENHWVLDGTEGSGRKTRAVRVVFTDLGTQAFRREHQVQVGGVWSDDDESVCRRIPAPPSPAPSHSARPHPSASPRDLAFHLVGGTWQCETIAGSPGTHVYAFARDGSIALRSELHLGDDTVAIEETYRFDSAHKMWSTTTQAGAYVGTAPPWLGPKWVFDGTAQIGGRPVPVQMVYTDLANRAFRRDFKQLRRGNWEVFTSETCERDF